MFRYANIKVMMLVALLRLCWFKALRDSASLRRGRKADVNSSPRAPRNVLTPKECLKNFKTHRKSSNSAAWVYHSFDILIDIKFFPMGQHRYPQSYSHLMWNIMVTNGFFLKPVPHSICNSTNSASQ